MASGSQHRTIARSANGWRALTVGIGADELRNVPDRRMTARRVIRQSFQKRDGLERPRVALQTALAGFVGDLDGLTLQWPESTEGITPFPADWGPW
jgi:hypothetical protein